MILAIDQGTTGTTCLVFDEEARLRSRAYREFRQHFPQPGWVEHDAGEIWEVSRRALAAWSNASRTMLFDTRKREWDADLCEALGVPGGALPEPVPSAQVYGETDPDAFLGARVPLAGMAGDQQAALFGQACLEPGLGKNTYGTGSFVLQNVGPEAPAARPGLLTTVAWGIADRAAYALEASVFVTGAAVQWLRDGLGIISAPG